jgi:hypothetical protein
MTGMIVAVRQMMSNNATRRRAGQGVVSGEMASNAADNRALDAASRFRAAGTDSDRHGHG